MARTTLSVQEVGIAGLNLSTEAAQVDGNAVPAAEGSKTLLLVDNGGGSPITVTVPATGRAYGISLEDQVVSVPAGESRYIAGLHPPAFQQTDGLIYINYSAVTSVTVAAFRIA